MIIHAHKGGFRGWREISRDALSWVALVALDAWLWWVAVALGAPVIAYIVPASGLVALICGAIVLWAFSDCGRR